MRASSPRRNRRWIIRLRRGIENDYDVIVEVFYEDFETAKIAMRSLADPEIRRLMEQDENAFILPGSIGRYVVEVYETVFRPIPREAI
jgi:hypothetical protein